MSRWRCKSLDLSLLDNGQGNAWPERYRLSRFLGRFALPGRTIDNFSAFWLIRCWSCLHASSHSIHSCLTIMYSKDKRPTITSSAAQSNHPSQTNGIPASTFSTPSIQTRAHVTSSPQPMPQTRTTGPEEKAEVDPKWSDVRVVHPAWEGWGIGPGGKSKL